MDMPTYEYECKACSLKFEVKKHFDEAVQANCPQCCGEARRLFSPVTIVFKGLGFYVTDNAAEEKNRLGSKREGDTPSDKAPKGKDEEKQSESAEVRPREDDPTKQH
jgi:putative FmdB family regulatory protein